SPRGGRSTTSSPRPSCARVSTCSSTASARSAPARLDAPRAGHYSEASRMTLARRVAPLASVLLLAAACGGGARGGPGLSDDALSQRVVDHYQKSISTPGVTFTVTKYEDAGIPGWRKGTMVVWLGRQTQNMGVY